MQYQSDYMMRLIEQLGGLLRRALHLADEGQAEESYQLADEALALALDLEPGIATRLSPQTLAGLLDMRNVDDRVIEFVAQAFDAQAAVLESSGELIEAGIRRSQASGVRALLDPSRAN